MEKQIRERKQSVTQGTRKCKKQKQKNISKFFHQLNLLICAEGSVGKREQKEAIESRYDGAALANPSDREDNLIA